MMNRYSLICISFLLILPFSFVNAQTEKRDYTYVSENQFLDIKELNNFTFYPIKMDINKSIPVSIKSENIKIHLTNNKIHFDGVSGLDSYSIISKSYSSTGFDFVINTGDIDFETADLKFVTDNNYHVHIIYLHSNNHGVYTFYLPYKSDFTYKSDKDFYTSKKVIKASDYDSILGKKIFPYFIAEDKQFYKKSKILKKQQVAFYFDEDRFAFLEGNESTFVEVRKHKKYKVSIPNMPRVKHCIELIADSDYKGCHIYIDSDNKISVIEYKEDLYFLLP